MILDDTNYIKLLTIDKAYAEENDFYIYDETTYRIVKQEELDIWMVIETPTSNNYLINYSRSLLQVDKSKTIEEIDTKSLKPLSWRIDNPYYGKHTGNML